MSERNGEAGLGAAQSNPEARTQARRALSDARHHLQKSALKLVGYLVVAYLVLRLVPTLEQALRSLKHVSREWVAGAIALEIVSETGFVVSWRAIVDPDRLLERDGRGRRMDQGCRLGATGRRSTRPGRDGVGGWILHRFGMPTKLIAERQFNLSFLNTAVDALALIVFGAGLATGILPGQTNLLLTLLPAALAAIGITLALLVAHRMRSYAGRLQGPPPEDRQRDHHARRCGRRHRTIAGSAGELAVRARSGGLPWV